MINPAHAQIHDSRFFGNLLPLPLPMKSVFEGKALEGREQTDLPPAGLRCAGRAARSARARSAGATALPRSPLSEGKTPDRSLPNSHGDHFFLCIEFAEIEA